MLALRHMIEWREAFAMRGCRAPSDRLTGEANAGLARLGAGPLTGAESLALVADYGIRVTAAVHGRRAGRRQLRHAEALGLPVVLKTDVAGIAHKSDVGGVVVGLATLDDVVLAYDDLAERLGSEVLVAEWIPDGVELALGIVRDPGLGPIVVLGAGGLLVELMHDRSVGLPPIDSERAFRMLDGLGVRGLLSGIRGEEPCDIDAVVRAVESVSQLAAELGGAIEALDVNPSGAGRREPSHLTHSSSPGPKSSLRGSFGERKGDRVGGEPAPTVRVEAVEAEIRDVDDLGRSVHRQVGRGTGDRGSPHHPVASRRRRPQRLRCRRHLRHSPLDRLWADGRA